MLAVGEVMERNEFLYQILKNKRDRQKSLKEYALEELVKAGVKLPDEPKAEIGRKGEESDYLTLPQDITRISDQEIGKYLNALTQQKAYVITLLSLAEVDVSDVELQRDSDYSHYYVNAPYLNVNDRKEYANQKTRKISETLNKAKAVLTLAERNVQALDALIFLVSREQTRRSSSLQQENRVHNLK